MSNKRELILNDFNYRYACKEFDPEKKISSEDFSLILETGRLSPSSFGFEPWKFLVIENNDLKNKIKNFAWGAQRQLPGASHFLILLARRAKDTVAESLYTKYIMSDIQKLPSDIIKMKSDFYKNFQEKDFDLTNERKLFDWASKQVYIPLANMMTSAAMLGIDSCPIEGFDQIKINALLSEEGIIDPKEFGAAAMVAFGYRAKETFVPNKTRRPKEEVIQWI